MQELLFKDRWQAGARLARLLSQWQGRDAPLVLALPRGGVPVGIQIARALKAEFDILLVRKLGLPGHRELAMGAIASDGIRVVNDDVIRDFHVSSEALERVTAAEKVELQRRSRVYRGNRPNPPMRGRTLIVADDGIATGATMRAAVQALRAKQPMRIVVAAPVVSPSAFDILSALADEVCCVAIPDDFEAIGGCYSEFAQLTDDEVVSMLRHQWNQTTDGELSIE